MTIQCNYDICTASTGACFRLTHEEQLVWRTPRRYWYSHPFVGREGEGMQRVCDGRVMIQELLTSGRVLSMLVSHHSRITVKG